MGDLIYNNIPIIKLKEISLQKKLPEPDFIARMPKIDEIIEYNLAFYNFKEENMIESPEKTEIFLHKTPDEIGQGCVTALKGKREYMEDTYQVASEFPYKFYAVYDGHGGSKVSELLQKDFHKYIFEALDRIPELKTEKSLLNLETIDKIKIEIIKAFELYDIYLYENKDKFGIKIDGSTATVVVDIGNYLIFANLGDSRSILIRDNRLEYSTWDHKPEEEYRRILIAGSYVNKPWGSNISRVGGILSVSRAFGDFIERLKIINGEYLGSNSPVSSKPDIDIIKKNKEDNEYVVLASDGLWDVFSSQDITNNINEYIQKRGISNTCKRLANDAIEIRNSEDNTTIMIFKV